MQISIYESSITGFVNFTLLENRLICIKVELRRSSEKIKLSSPASTTLCAIRNFPPKALIVQRHLSSVLYIVSTEKIIPTLLWNNFKVTFRGLLCTRRSLQPSRSSLGDYSTEQWGDLPACLFYFYITRQIRWNACTYLCAPTCTRGRETLPRFFNAGAEAPQRKSLQQPPSFLSVFTGMLCANANSGERPYPSCRGGINRTRQNETVLCASLSPPGPDGSASPCTRSERDRRRTSSASTSPGASPN